jgi:SAM-dependent methyltransferase
MQIDSKSKIDRLTGRNSSVQALINLIPKQIRLKTNPNRYYVTKFLEERSKKLKKGSKILDAGAGPCPYKYMFEHCRYEATDIKDPYKIMSFTCSLDSIPRKNGFYDAVLSTQVLEHVEYPQKVINEFFRILKPNGKLFLTCPQGWMVHQKPYHFYNFTKYGIESLLKNAGFKKYTIKPKGGYFVFLADAIKFNNIPSQYKNFKLLYYLLRILGFPFTQIFIPLLSLCLDSLDKKKDWTMGYNVEAIK